MKEIYDLPQTNRLVDLAVNTFDKETQDLILIGEMAELTEALLNRRRGRSDKANVEEELSHVLISCEVVRRNLAIEADKIEAQSAAKLAKYNQ